MHSKIALSAEITNKLPDYLPEYLPIITILTLMQHLIADLQLYFISHLTTAITWFFIKR